jgi:ATP-dependent DNA helicase DinG
VSPPHLLAIATLPLPSLEDPLVAGRVAYHKRNRQDWFRLYLLPTALNELQRAVAPVRSAQGIVALFDNRVLHRSYGQQVLAALSPLARIDYLDQTWLMN